MGKATSVSKFSQIILICAQFMGVIEEVGSEVKKVKKGGRYVCCFDISCGDCFYCKREPGLCSSPVFDTLEELGCLEWAGTALNMNPALPSAPREQSKSS